MPFRYIYIINIHTYAKIYHLYLYTFESSKISLVCTFSYLWKVPVNQMWRDSGGRGPNGPGGNEGPRVGCVCIEVNVFP